MHGELSTFKKALLPAGAAIGGMVVPMIIYFVFNHTNGNQHGWAIPSATDIAFSLGIVSLLGKKIPLSLRIFLTALAIIDDLGAIIVIALFYATDISIFYVGMSVAIVLLLLLHSFISKTFGLVQILLGVMLWFCMFNSGIHASIAGVVTAFFVPASFLDKLEARLHGFVYYGIIPLFALANTAILLPQNGWNLLGSNLSLGIIFGLWLGKPIGIFIVSFILIKLKVAVLPKNTRFIQLAGIGMLAGIGFTMSLFISSLAFQTEEKQNIAKVAVLAASLLATITATLWINYTGKKIIVGRKHRQSISP